MGLEKTRHRGGSESTLTENASTPEWQLRGRPERLERRHPYMRQKRTTAPGGVRGALGPPEARPVKEAISPQRRIMPAQAAHAAVELARERRHLHHRPTVPQL